MSFELRKLEDVCDILDHMRIPITSMDRKAGPYPYYGANGIQDYIDDYIFDDELVLLAEDGGNFGSKEKPIAYRISGKTWVNNHAHVIKPKNIIDVDYLCYSLMYYDVSGLVNGATRQKLTQSEMRKINIRYRSLEKQRQIVFEIKLVSNIISSRKHQLCNLDLLVKSRFVEMFGELKSNSKKWVIEPFDYFATIDGNMTTDFVKYANYPHIGIDSIEKNSGILKGYKTVKEDGVKSGKYIFNEEHIIYSKIRPNLNKVALPDFEGLCSADAYPILVKKDVCNRIYLVYVMRSSYFLDYILAFSSRTNMPKVNRAQVKGFSMPLPPVQLQNQFASFVVQVDKSKFVVTAKFQ